MTLANLLAIQRLQAFNATPQGVQRLLAAATRNQADALLAQTRQFLQTKFPDLLVKPNKP